MSVDVTKALLLSDRVALKLVDAGSGSVVAPSTASIAQNTVVIPHGLGTVDKVFWTVSAFNTIFTQYVNAPFTTPDGRIALDAFIDSTNLYIRATSQTAGAPQDASTFNFTYTILIA